MIYIRCICIIGNKNDLPLYNEVSDISKSQWWCDFFPQALRSTLHSCQGQHYYNKYLKLIFIKIRIIIPN